MSEPIAPSATGYPPRILRVVYRSNYHPRRVSAVVVKVPYSGIFDLTEVLARAVSTNEILWFRVQPVPPKQITPELRASLVRWPAGLKATTERSGVTWAV